MKECNCCDGLGTTQHFVDGELETDTCGRCNGKGTLTMSHPTQNTPEQGFIPCQFCDDEKATYFRYQPEGYNGLAYDLCDECMEKHRDTWAWICGLGSKKKLDLTKE
jgi:RecJ-like exonuclease